jgi:hypothetical protein
MKLLQDISIHHPSLWGQLGVVGSQGLLTWQDCTVTPPYRIRGAQSSWWRKFGFGCYDKNGLLIDSLCYKRGGRYIYRPAEKLSSTWQKASKCKHIDTVLYGGFISDHFGHLVLDLNRAYQLCRAYRDSGLPIWFHYVPSPWPREIKRPPLSELAMNWFDELGLSARIKLIRKPIRANKLISCVSLFNDLAFASRDLGPACQAALKPKLRDQLAATKPQYRVAYFSRHKLGTGTTRYIGELELVQKLEDLRHVDVYCPEDLSFDQKLAIYKKYEYVAAFPQSCLALKLFTPPDQCAKQLLLIAGDKSLSSSWVNIDRATNAQDYYHTCTERYGYPIEVGHSTAMAEGSPFARSNSFDVESAYGSIKDLVK